MIQKILKLPDYLLLLIVSGFVLIAYSNHFGNDFQFDDTHTIPENDAIRSLDIVSFFTDAGTFSAHPAHKVYRPITTLENAIDYAIAGELTPISFHIHIILVYIATCFLIYFFIFKLLENHFDSSKNYNRIFSLLVTTFFALAKANSETVNYIIQRAEITSCFFIILGLLTYIKGGIWKSKYLYLIFPIIAFMSKEMGFVFAPLLFIYILLFEENIRTQYFFKKEELNKLLRSTKKVMPAFIITVLYYFFYKYMSNLYHGSEETYRYFITQPMVISYYVYTYLFPFDLSSIPDWKLYDSIFYYKTIIGFLCIFLLLATIILTSFKKSTKLIAFGLAWFLLSLLPSSSIIPFAEVANSHRAFIPYVGLTIALISSFDLLRKFLINKYSQKLYINNTFLIGFTLVVTLNAYGAYQRNKVWKTFDSLWAEMYIDNPNNLNAKNNAILIYMRNGEYIKAKKLLNENIKSNPYYATSYTNLAIIQDIEGNKNDAENNLKKAIALKHPLYENPEAHYFYGKFLFDNNRFYEAINQFEITIQKSPKNFPYESSVELLLQSYHKTENWNLLKSLAEKSEDSRLKEYYTDIANQKKSISQIELENIDKNPDKEKYLNLSLKFIQQKKYHLAVIAAKKSIQIDNNFASAYNNLGFAYFSLNEFDKAIQAYSTAIKLNPDYSLAINNLNIAKAYKEAKNNSSTELSSFLTEMDYINISLLNYKNGDYNTCISNSLKSIQIKPTSLAYNNICSAYNELKEFKKAEEACNKALSLNPNNNVAQNNLQIAKQNQ